jgi:hypothetical protein
MFSPRMLGSMLIRRKAASSQSEDSALRKVLRRCPNAAATPCANTAGSLMEGFAAPSGTSLATAESILGAGRKAPGGTTKSRLIANFTCSITVSLP